MSDVVEGYEYKGYEVEIRYDWDAQSPLENNEYPGEHIWTRNRDYDFTTNFENGDFDMGAGTYGLYYGYEMTDEDGDVVWTEEYAETLDDIINHLQTRHGAEVLVIKAYIHSGITVSASPAVYNRFPDQQWDVSTMGIIWMSEDDIRKEISAYDEPGKGAYLWTSRYVVDERDDRGLVTRGHHEWRLLSEPDVWGRKAPQYEDVVVTEEHRQMARDRMLGTIKELDDYLTGSVYGYEVTSPTGDQDSCWGFIGDMEYCKSEANNAVDGMIEWKDKQDAEAIETFARILEEDEVA